MALENCFFDSKFMENFDIFDDAFKYLNSLPVDSRYNADLYLGIAILKALSTEKRTITKNDVSEIRPIELYRWVNNNSGGPWSLIRAFAKNSCEISYYDSNSLGITKSSLNTHLSSIEFSPEHNYAVTNRIHMVYDSNISRKDISVIANSFNDIFINKGMDTVVLDSYSDFDGFRMNENFVRNETKFEILPNFSTLEDIPKGHYGHNVLFKISRPRFVGSMNDVIIEQVLNSDFDYLAKFKDMIENL